MIALYKKELRGMLPLLALVGVVFAGDFLYRPLAGRLDEISWVEQNSQLGAGKGTEYALVLLVFGLAAAYSVFPREHDEKTIELLYALPISRPRIFAAKALAAWTVLVLAVVLDQIAGTAVQALNPQSFSGDQWRLGLAAELTGLDGFFCAVILAHGLLISFARRFGLVLYALAGVIVMQVDKHFPDYAFLDPTELLAFSFRGSELVVPWTGVAFQGALALAAAALAYALWMGPAERATRLYARVQAHLAGRIALGCATLTVLGVGLGWLAVEVADQAAEPPPVQYSSFLPARAETVWYDFTYPSEFRQRAYELIRRADRVYEEVAVALEAEPGFRIDADLTDPGIAHAGVAQGGVIRVALARLEGEEALAALYHETVHGFQFHLAGGRIPGHMASIRFFVEGSAEYVAAELTGDPARRRAHRRLAVAAYERHRIDFEELIDDEAFSAAHDGTLVYALGETWTAALAEVCGAGAISGFFRALGRDDAPEDLDGLPLWQDTLRARGCAVERVTARWGEDMAGLARAEQAFLAALPRLGGGAVGVADGELVFRIGLDRPAPDPAALFYLRLRRHPGDPDEEIPTFHGTLGDDGTSVELRIPGSWATGSLEYQLGQAVPGSLWPYFEDWQVVTFGRP